MTNNYLSINGQQIPLNQQTTIGRLPNNHIQIDHNTVSKNHATILLYNQKCYLVDLNSINGTYLNGNKINQGEKVQLLHNDCIQLGKSDKLYTFKSKYPTTKTKKINLKDYYFQDIQQKTQNNLSKTYNQPKPQQLQNNNHQSKPKQSKLKIPQLSEFLRFDQPDTQPTKPNIKKGQSKIKINQLNNLLHNNTLDLQANMNIYLKQKQRKRKQQENFNKIKQEQLKLLIEKAKQQQLLLQKQIQMENKIRQEEQKIHQERRKVQRQLQLNAKQRKQQQQKLKQQLQEKQKQYIEKLKIQKDIQIAQLKKQQQSIRQTHQQQIKNDYQLKKKQLELEAEALARQYQNIYRQTIQKVKEDMTQQENKISNLKQKIQQLTEEITHLNLQLESKKNLSQELKHNYLVINSKNKALILYASQLQNRIDRLKQQYSSTLEKDKNKNKYNQLKQSIINSRKLLKIKNVEKNNLQKQINNARMDLMQLQGYNQKIQDYIENILEKKQEIKRLKQQYYQYAEQQNHLESMWQSELQAHDTLLQTQKSNQLQLNANSNTINQSLNDNIQKLTQQHLYALKIIQPHISEEQRKAAKYLIQQMLDLHQQIAQFNNKNQSYHLQINKTIIRSEYLRKENQYLAELLFGEGSIHHFDNMKLIIQELIQKIGIYRQGGGIQNCIKLSKQILQMEQKIDQQNQRLKDLKKQEKQYAGSGNRIIKINKNNPLNFFGEQLAKKQIYIMEYQNSIKNYENKLNQQNQVIKNLQLRKKDLSQKFQKYKRTQFQQAKNWIN